MRSVIDALMYIEKHTKKGISGKSSYDHPKLNFKLTRSCFVV